MTRGSRSAVIVFIVALASSQVRGEIVNVVLVTDGPSDWSNRLVQNVTRELRSMSDVDFQIKVSEAGVYTLGWDPDQAIPVIDRAMANPDIDLVIALGVLASAPLADYVPDKPLIAAIVIDPVRQGFPTTASATSGVENLHFLSAAVDLANELARFQSITQARHIALLTDELLQTALPAVTAHLEAVASSQDVRISIVPSSRAQDPLGQLPEGVDAVFVLPQTRMDPQWNLELIASLKRRSLPSYTMMGEEQVRRGFLMGRRLVPGPETLARQLAVDVRDIALGRPASDLRVTFDFEERWIVNAGAARESGFDVPFDLIINARLINDELQSGSQLTLGDALDRALQANLNLAIAEESYRLTEEDTRIARSALLPQLTGDMAWQALDRDLATTGPDRSTEVAVSFSQSLYSETTWSEYTSTRFLQQSQAAELQSSRLDTIEETAVAYIGVLLGKTELDIQVDNLNLTRANLERARFRYSVGAANRSEVHRFETEVGNDQQAVANARSQLERANFELNRLLRQPIDTPVRTVEPGISDPRIFGDKRLQSLLRGPAQVAAFSSFLVDQSLANAPELSALDARIAAQQRRLLAAQRKRYVPDVNLVGGVERVVDDHGARIQRDFDNDWSVGVQFSLPIYEGNRIAAERRRAESELLRLKLTHEQQTDVIETETRTAVAQATASRLTIDFAQASAAAAARTLSLVTDAYVRGASSYIDLIDAQNVHLTARLASSSAAFEHLQDLVQLQRATGFFDFYVSPAEADAWFDALAEHLRNYEG